MWYGRTVEQSNSRTLLEQGVDKRRQRGPLGRHQDQAETEQHKNQWDHPPQLPLSKEGEEFPENRDLRAHTLEPTNDVPLFSKSVRRFGSSAVREQSL